MGTIRKRGNSYFVDFYIRGTRIRVQKTCKSKLSAEILLDFMMDVVEASELFDYIVERFSNRFERKRFINYSNGQELRNFCEEVLNKVSVL